LKVPAADNRAVFTAAADAQRAAEFVNRKARETAGSTRRVLGARLTPTGKPEPTAPCLAPRANPVMRVADRLPRDLGGISSRGLQPTEEMR